MKTTRFFILAAVAISLFIGLPPMGRLQAVSSASSARAASARLAETEPTMILGLFSATGTEPNEVVFWSFKEIEMIAQRKPITGLQPGEKITGADYSPLDDKIIATSNLGGLYKIDKTTGSAIQAGEVSSSFTNPNIGLDLDPITQFARLLNNEVMKNVVVDFSTGTIKDFDRDLSYAPDDPKAGQKPALSGIAYRDNRPAQNTSSLYGIDVQQNTLVEIDPSTGKVRTIGPLGVDTTDVVGFDISPNGIALASLTDPNSPLSSKLFRINLDTGTATEIGTLGGDKPASAIVLDVVIEFAGGLECMIMPESKTNPVGTSHSFEVIVKKDGKPIEGAGVSGGLDSGPNHPLGFPTTQTKDDPNTQEKDPKAGFTYQSNGFPGTDDIHILAAFEGEICECRATKTWELGQLSIDSVARSGKNIVVTGCCFKEGDKIFINDAQQKTKMDPDNPDTVLTAKKAFKKLEECTADFKNRVFVRRQPPGKPIQDTEAFATCP